MTHIVRPGQIVLNIPHSSPVFPFGKTRWSVGIDSHLERWTDWYTDWLFTSAAMKDYRIKPVTFPFSRFFCDVERLIDDPLEETGQGIIYTGFEECRREIRKDERNALIDMFYHKHIERLKSVLTPSTFLIDCHSFPDDLSEADICIGINDDWSKPDAGIIDDVVQVFNKHQYITRINDPYSNSISPKMPFPYPSMMIELNKRVYMGNSRDLDLNKAIEVIRALTQVYGRILSAFS